MPASSCRRMITLRVKITSFYFTVGVDLLRLQAPVMKNNLPCFTFAVRRTRPLTQTPSSSSSSFRQRCRIGVIISHRTSAPASNSHSICLSARRSPSPRCEVTERQLPNTSRRPCDSPSPRPVCLMPVTKDLTPDLSAPDESPAAR